MEIKLEEYLSESEIKTIIESEIRNQVSMYLRKSDKGVTKNVD